MRTRVQVVCAVFVVSACTPSTGEPALELTLTPKVVSDATPIKVRVVGTKADGTVGSGTVKITSARGSLTSPIDVQLDGFGSATAELICNPATEPECAQSVRVAGEWTSDGKTVTAEARFSGAADAGSGGADAGSVDPSGRQMYFFGDIFRNPDLIASSYHPVADINSPTGLMPRNFFQAAISPERRFYYSTAGSLQTPARIFEAVQEPVVTWDTTDNANDVELPQPCGTGQLDLRFFGIFPDTGQLAFGCQDPAKSTPALRGTNAIIELGWDGHFIASSATGYSLWKGSQEIALPWPYLSGNGNGVFFHATALPTGFIVNADCEVALVSFTGVVTTLGRFSNPVPQTATPDPDECCRASVTPDGVGWVNSTRTDVIGRCQQGGVNQAMWNIARGPPFVWTGQNPVIPPSYLGKMVYR